MEFTSAVQSDSRFTHIFCQQATCKPVTELMQQEMKTLQDSAVSDSVVLRILASMGLSYHGILYETIEYISCAEGLHSCQC